MKRLRGWAVFCGTDAWDLWNYKVSARNDAARRNAESQSDDAKVVRVVEVSALQEKLLTMVLDANIFELPTNLRRLRIAIARKGE